MKWKSRNERGEAEREEGRAIHQAAHAEGPADVARAGGDVDLDGECDEEAREYPAQALRGDAKSEQCECADGCPGDETVVRAEEERDETGPGPAHECAALGDREEGAIEDFPADHLREEDDERCDGHGGDFWNGAMAFAEEDIERGRDDEDDVLPTDKGDESNGGAHECPGPDAGLFTEARPEEEEERDSE